MLIAFHIYKDTSPLFVDIVLLPNILFREADYMPQNDIIDSDVCVFINHFSCISINHEIFKSSNSINGYLITYVCLRLKLIHVSKRCRNIGVFMPNTALSQWKTWVVWMSQTHLNSTRRNSRSSTTSVAVVQIIAQCAAVILCNISKRLCNWTIREGQTSSL